MNVTENASNVERWFCLECFGERDGRLLRRLALPGRDDETIPDSMINAIFKVEKDIPLHDVSRLQLWKSEYSASVCSEDAHSCRAPSSSETHLIRGDGFP